MKFVEKIALTDVPIIKDREDYCINTWHCPEEWKQRCYMCTHVTEDEIRKWLRRWEDRYLYIVRQERFSTRAKACPWCGLLGGCNEAHFISRHNKSIEEFHLRQTQSALWKEVVWVRRTGRWWAIGLTISGCHHCPNPSRPDDAGYNRKCSMAKSSKNKNRCVFSMCLDLFAIREEYREEYWKYGVVLV